MGCSSSTLKIKIEPADYININTLSCCYNSWEEMKQQPNNRSNIIFCKWSLNSHSNNSSSGRQIHLIPSVFENINTNQFDLADNIPDTIEERSETLSGSQVPIIVVQQPEV